MARTPRRYAIHLFLSGGHHQEVHFNTLEDFQTWYGGVLNAASLDAFVNVPISDLTSEFLVLRAGSVQAIRVEPIYGALED
ncbi:hypothetical protein KBY82_14200 [Cyanobium sp. AMD-g]|jgi:hypothetical protein|uniref:hypothetical protein n=1 Tax=Cyanobium sp. AMD-g TaxID=2823699 RepID=UPI0020CC1AC7|nr:hypothetical protein [Cyanobium sp. AMD-g]MCP9931932.1 hypothetical protein [Cyanobium sp. AMD-g]